MASPAAPELELFPGRTIGGGHPTFFLAEGGLNHNGDMDIAKKLIEKAKLVGADAIKFQKRTTDAILTRAALNAPYLGPNSFGETYGEHREVLEFSEEQWVELRKFAEHVGIPLTGSGWDENSVDVLDRVGVPFFKVASADLLNFPLLAHTASKGKPVIISTGMATMEDVQAAVAFMRQHTSRLVVLHCTSTYPAKIESCNLRAVQTFREAFPDIVIGYSGHENGIAISQAVAVMGAKFIERHFTLDRTMKGGDHAASLEPRGFMILVDTVRKVESAYGDGVKRLMDGELAVKKKLAKSLVSARAIKAGEVITAAMLCAKSPGDGIPPSEAEGVIGTVAAVDIEGDVAISQEMFSSASGNNNKTSESKAFMMIAKASTVEEHAL